MKRGALIILVAFFLVAFIFSISFVAAACAPNDIILKLSSQTNAHAENASMPNYGVEICYSNIFGAPPANPHACTGNNVVLRLSNPINAHAENGSESTPGYIDLCYGGLTCVLESSACTGGRSPVVNLYSPKNAHLENASLSNYNYVVCCSAGGGPGPAECNDAIDNTDSEDTLIDIADPGCHTDGNPANPGSYDPNDNDETDIAASTAIAYWEIGGVQAANNYKLHVGDSIQLVAKGVVAPDGTTITFEVYDNDTGETSGGTDDAIKNITAIVSAGIARATTSFNLEFWNGNPGGEGDDTLLLELYFIAKNTTLPTPYSQPSNNTILLNSTFSPVVVDTKGCVQFITQSVCEDPDNPKLPGAIGYEEEQYFIKTGNKVAGVECGYSSLTNKVICRCLWNASLTKDNCYFNWKNVTQGVNPGNPNFDCAGGCNIFSNLGECIDNKMTLTYSATFGPDPTCTTGALPLNSQEESKCLQMDNKNEELICGLAPSLMLPFFTGMQFFITIITLILIYSLIILTRRN